MMAFGEPAVRDRPLHYDAFVWPSHGSLDMPLPTQEVVFATRRSERILVPLTLVQLSALLWHTARCRESLPGPEGFALQSRPVPSAGAIHPIHLLCELPDQTGWSRYDPFAHKLDILPEEMELANLRARATDFMGSTQGTLMAFVAEPGLTTAKYRDAESLVWRDAGVIQGAISAIAPSLGLGTCLLGLAGNGAVATLGEQGQLVGVGTMVLGVPP